MQYLAGLDRSHHRARVQHTLWENYARSLSMPFVASRPCPACMLRSPCCSRLGWRTSRWLGWVLTCFAGVVSSALVHPGWHYAVDGASARGTLAIWGRRPPRPPAGTAVTALSEPRLISENGLCPERRRCGRAAEQRPSRAGDVHTRRLPGRVGCGLTGCSQRRLRQLLLCSHRTAYMESARLVTRWRNCGPGTVSPPGERKGRPECGRYSRRID
jgi:hypothetical protein